MFFQKREKKKFRPMLTLTVTALCALGACSLGTAVKRKAARMGDCIRKLCRGKRKDECACAAED